MKYILANIEIMMVGRDGRNAKRSGGAIRPFRFIWLILFAFSCNLPGEKSGNKQIEKEYLLSPEDTIIKWGEIIDRNGDTMYLFKPVKKELIPTHFKTSITP